MTNTIDSYLDLICEIIYNRSGVTATLRETVSVAPQDRPTAMDSGRAYLRSGNYSHFLE